MSSKNNIQIIIVEDQRRRLEYLIDRFKFIVRGISLTEPEFLAKNDEISFGLTIENKNYNYILIKTLALNGFKVQSDDKKIIDIIAQVNNKYHDELQFYASKANVDKRINKKHDTLDELIRSGKYKEVIKVAKDITYSPEVIEKARSSISLAVTNAIMKNIEEYSKNKENFKTIISNLLLITCEIELKYHNCNELMMEAGIIAIELSSKESDTINHLIKIANQKTISPILNIKATIKFADIVLQNPTKFEKNLKYAYKELNTKWLLIVFETITNKISPDDYHLFIKFIDIIRNSRY